MSDPSSPWLLAIDTATSRIVVGAGTLAGEPLAVLGWPAGHRHGERLLAGVEAVVAEARVELADLAGVIVGTGPGAFTGLRVGLATAKTLAHARRLPIVGIPTSDALRAAFIVGTSTATDAPTTLLLPAGPNDRVVIRPGEPPAILRAGTEPDAGDGAGAGAEIARADAATGLVVAVDLAGRASIEASARGDAALDGLGPALLRLGAARLAAGESDDAELLVPEYVTLPRGVAVATGEVRMAHDTP